MALGFLYFILLIISHIVSKMNFSSFTFLPLLYYIPVITSHIASEISFSSIIGSLQYNHLCYSVGYGNVLHSSE